MTSKNSSHFEHLNSYIGIILPYLIKTIPVFFLFYPSSGNCSHLIDMEINHNMAYCQDDAGSADCSRSSLAWVKVA